MIKITVEIWPYGSEIAQYRIAEGVIYNDETGNYTSGNYKSSLQVYGRDNQSYQSEVKNFARADKNVWELLKEVLNNAKETEDIEERSRRAFKGPSTKVVQDSQRRFDKSPKKRDNTSGVQRSSQTNSRKQVIDDEFLARMCYSLDIAAEPKSKLVKQANVFINAGSVGLPVKCLHCGHVIQSMHRHNFVWCKCNTIAIDGGSAYTKMSYKTGSKYSFDLDTPVVGPYIEQDHNDNANNGC